MKRCSHCGGMFTGKESFCSLDGTPLTSTTPFNKQNDSRKMFLYLCGCLIVMVVACKIIEGIGTYLEGEKASKAVPVITPTPKPTPANDAERLAAAKKHTPSIAAIDNTREAIGYLQTISPKAPEYKEAQKLLKQFQSRADVIAKENAKQVAEDALLGPKPENSQWDGSVRCVDRYLKATLNDYDSAEYVEWSPVVKLDLKGEPYWAVRLKLRATNAFGGKILKEAIFFIRNDRVVEAVGL